MFAVFGIRVYFASVTCYKKQRLSCPHRWTTFADCLSQKTFFLAPSWTARFRASTSSKKQRCREFVCLYRNCPQGWLKHRFAGRGLHCLQENGTLTVSYDGKSADIKLHVPRSAGEAFARARNASQSHFCVRGFHDRIRNRLRYVSHYCIDMSLLC